MKWEKTQSGSWFILIALAVLLGWTGWSALTRTVRLDAPGGRPMNSTSLPDMRVDINAAGVAELSVLPAIGPGLAERIVADRNQRGPFESVESLTRVSGIGKSTIDRLKPYAVAIPLDRKAPTHE